MGKFSRDKGARSERQLARFLRSVGLAAERVPLSGAARGRFGSDVSLPLMGVDRRGEVKVRRNGFKQLYKWLDGSDFLVVKADRHEALAVLPLRFAIEIVKAAERRRGKA